MVLIKGALATAALFAIFTTVLATTLIPEAPAPEDWDATVFEDGEEPPIPEIIEITPEEMAAFRLSLAEGDVNATYAPPHPDFFFPGDPDFEEEGHEAARRGIIGVDDRVLQTDTTTYPFSAMGRVQRQEGNTCTGSLIGPRHVITARHCYRDGQWIRFSPGYYDGERNGGAYAAQIFRSSTLLPGPGWTSCDFRDDFIVLVLGTSRLGEQFGYLGARYVESNMINAAPFRHVGYPGDRDGAQRPYRQDRVNLHRYDACDGTGPMATNADMYGGQSGGPLWLYWSDGGHYVLGVASASSDAESTFASGSNLVQYVIQARNDFP